MHMPKLREPVAHLPVITAGGDETKASKTSNSGPLFCSRTWTMRACIGCAWVASAWIGSVSINAAWAEANFTPYLNEQYVHDSNVFSFSGEEEALARTGETNMDDQIRRDTLGLRLGYLLGSSTLLFNAEGRRFTHERFTQLDREESALGLDAVWQASHLTRLNLTANVERRLASTADRDNTKLVLEREILGGVEVVMSPNVPLQLILALGTRELKAPLENRPEFGLTEQAAGLSLRQAEGPAFRFGVSGEWIDGHYREAPDLERYKQINLTGTLDYAVDGLTQMSLEVGQTHREVTVGEAANLDAISGSLGLQRSLSAVSILDMTLFRRLVSYTAGSAAILEEGARLSLDWRPLAHLTASLSAENLNSTFQDAPLYPEREDKYQAVSLAFDYTFFPHFRLQPELSWRQRDSNYPSESYEGWQVGLSLGMEL